LYLDIINLFLRILSIMKEDWCLLKTNLDLLGLFFYWYTLDSFF
jgi:hypothetical protein